MSAAPLANALFTMSNSAAKSTQLIPENREKNRDFFSKVLREAAKV